MTVAPARSRRLDPISERASRGSTPLSTGSSQRDVALILGQHGVAFGVDVEGGSAVRADQQPRDVRFAFDVPPSVGTASARVGGRAEALAKDDIHDPLVGAIAVLERDFLGQDLGPLDRFGRDVAKLAEAGDALAVEQQDRPFAAAPAGTAELRRKRFEQLVDAGRAGRPYVAAVEHVFGRDVADHGAALALAGDDDGVGIELVELVHSPGRQAGRRGRGLGAVAGRWRGVAAKASAVLASRSIFMCIRRPFRRARLYPR